MLLFLLFSNFFVCFSKLKLLSPENNSLYLILPSYTSTQIPVRYLNTKILKDQKKDSNNNKQEEQQQQQKEEEEIVCIKLVALSSKKEQQQEKQQDEKQQNEEEEVIFENYCLKETENYLNLHHITKGKYLLTFYFLNHEEEVNDSYQTYFNVVTFEDILPQLIGPSNQEYLANSLTNSSDIVFEYDLSDLTLRKYLLVCLEISPISPSTFIGPRSCIPSDQNQVTLYNIPAGKYNLTLELQYTSNPYTSYPQTRTTSIIEIHQLSNILPTLHLQNKNIEYGISHDKKYIDEISFSVTTTMNQLYPHVELLSHVDTCLYLYPNLNSGLSKMSHCILSAPNLKFSLQKIPHGIHNFTVGLRSHHNPDVLFPLSEIEGKILVEEMKEFVPSYDWQELKPWHTIPSGVETRLPIGVIGRKEARIPQPWRLQASMPNPCKYFLRMDISRSTKVIQIREAAANKCKKPISCFQIFVGDNETPPDDNETSESLNLFLYPIEIEYLSSNEECETSS